MYIMLIVKWISMLNLITVEYIKSPNLISYYATFVSLHALPVLREAGDFIS